MLLFITIMFVMLFILFFWSCFWFHIMTYNAVYVGVDIMGANVYVWLWMH